MQCPVKGGLWAILNSESVPPHSEIFLRMCPISHPRVLGERQGNAKGMLNGISQNAFPIDFSVRFLLSGTVL